MNTLLPNGQILSFGYNMGYSHSVQPLIHNTLQPTILPEHNYYHGSESWRAGWEEPKIDYWKVQPLTARYLLDNK